MTILYSDDFTGADGSAPNSAKWDKAAWLWNTSNSPNPPTITGNLLSLNQSNYCCGVFSVTAFDLTAGGVHVKAVSVPLDAGATSALALHSSTSSNTPFHRIFVDNSGTLYIEDSSGYRYSRPYSSTSDVYWRLQALSGNVQAYTSPTGAPGSWVAVGGARPSLITLSSAKASLSHGRWTGPAAASGVLFDNYQVDTDAIADANAGESVAGIASNVPGGRIFKHSGSVWSIGATGSITEVGVYTGFTPNQIRLVQDGTSTPLSGFDWMTIGSATAGNYAHTFTNVPQAVGTGWYNVQLRDSAAPGTIYTTGKRGVGIHIGVYGQSQATGNAATGDNTLTPTGMSRVHGDQYSGLLTWASLQPGTMNGYIAADILLNSLTGGKVPIAFLNVGYPGIALVTGGNGTWLPLTNQYYTYVKNMLTALEGSVDAFVHIGGESDAAASVTQADFYAGLGTLFSATRTDCGNPNLPIIQVILGNAGSYWNDAQGEVIRAAQVQRCGDANTYRVESYDAELSGDLLHRSAAGYAEVARRWARAVAYAMGLTANWRSPRITAVSAVSQTVYDATIAYDGATDFTPASGVTGLRVTDSILATVITPTSVVRQNANTLRLTLPSAPANVPKIAVAYGASAASNFADNSALGLPLEYTSGVVSSAFVAKHCTLTLTTNGVTPAASQSGIVWAWWDAAPPNLTSTPSVSGTGASTNGSGVFDVPLAGTTLAVGQVGTLLALVSDGTPGSNSNKAFCAPVVVS